MTGFPQVHQPGWDKPADIPAEVLAHAARHAADANADLEQTTDDLTAAVDLAKPKRRAAKKTPGREVPPSS